MGRIPLDILYADGADGGRGIGITRGNPEEAGNKETSKENE
jgi:hypothetical protein